MSKYSITNYEDTYRERWDSFVSKSDNGTIFQCLDFLSYHEDKFKGLENHIIWLKGQSIFAVMPLAVFEGGVAKSPYGASYGGIVVNDKMNLSKMIKMTDLLKEYAQSKELSKVHITPTPEYYSDTQSQVLQYALSKKNFNIVSRDAFHVIKLNTYEDAWDGYESRARNTIRNYKEEFEIVKDASVEEFYPILSEDKERHNATATHTLDELKKIKSIIGCKLHIDIAKHKESGGRAGICYFKCNENVILTFYMSQDDLGKGKNGLNVLIDFGIKNAVESGFKYLDFGGSTIGYKVQNIGVSKFKESFGARVFLRETYELNLNG